MSWYTRKIAGIIFASPPTATFHDALEYFLMADKSKWHYFKYIVFVSIPARIIMVVQ